MDKKYRVVFPFVEAGLGHIMPMTAIADAFEAKYGDRAEVIRTRFFKDKQDQAMLEVEEDFITQVKLHNAHRSRGTIQFLAMRIAGPKLSMKFLMQSRYKKCFPQALAYIAELKPDLIFNTHFSTLYYSNEARKRGLVDTKVAAYCPDPIIGLQWDARTDLIGVSSAHGAQKARSSFNFRKTKIVDIPFLIRSEIKNYTQTKQYYRQQIGAPADQFTVLLADGAYGAGKLKDTVLGLLQAPVPMTIIAVCGRNEELYQEFLKLEVPDHICFLPYGFTDKMLTLSAACDLFVGKAGASNLAEPIYFGSPAIVTFCATPIETWICDHYVHSGCALKITNVEKTVATVRQWIADPSLMQPLIDQTQKHRRHDGPEIFADILWQELTGEEVSK